MGEYLDPNALSEPFYKELLHILGLSEIENRKIIINRDNTDGFALEIEKKLKDKGKHDFDDVMGLIITWLNRILFLKLLESRLLSFNDDGNLAFLTSSKISSFNRLQNLFFEVLAKNYHEREEADSTFSHLPYLNSSLFAKSELEKFLEINELDSDMQISYYNATVLMEREKRKEGGVRFLTYLFDFLSAYDFGIKERGEVDSRRLIRASVLGSVFERLNGYKEGSFYTPSFITNYICRDSIHRIVVDRFNKDFESNARDIDEVAEDIRRKRRSYERGSTEELDFLKSIKDMILDIRICDPAVGSGYFLISSLNVLLLLLDRLNLFLIDEKLRVKELEKKKNTKEIESITLNQNLDDIVFSLRLDSDELEIYNPEKNYVIEYKRPLLHHGKHDNEVLKKHIIQKAVFNAKTQIIESCLFGVDINNNSSEIARLRLWIELLKHSYYIDVVAGDSTSDKQSNPPYHAKSQGELLESFLTDSNRDVSLNAQHNAVASHQHNGKARHCELFPSHSNDPRHFDTHRHSEALAEESKKQSKKSKKRSEKSSQTPPYPARTEGGVLESTKIHKLQTLPNVDIMMRKGNSLFNNIPLDMDRDKMLDILKKNLDEGKLDLNYDRELQTSINNIQNKLPETITKYKNATNEYKREKNRDLRDILKNVINDSRQFILDIFQTINPKYQTFKEKLSFYLKTYGYYGIDNAPIEDSTIKKLNEYTINFNFHKIKGLINEDSDRYDEKELETLIKKMEEYENLKDETRERTFEWRFQFPEVLDSKGDFKGFDLIVGNPPYIRQEEIKHLKTDLQKKFSIYKGTSDIYTYFFEQGYNLLKENGILSMITSNKWTRAGYGEPLRAFLLKHVKILSYTELNGIKVFEKATVDTSILSFQKIVAHKDSTFRYIKGNKEKLESNAPMSYGTLRQDSLSSDGFIFSDERAAALKAKIEKIGTPLKDWDISINCGIKTGYNEAFIIDSKKRDEILAMCDDSDDSLLPYPLGLYSHYESSLRDVSLNAQHDGGMDSQHDVVETSQHDKRDVSGIRPQHDVHRHSEHSEESIRHSDIPSCHSERSEESQQTTESKHRKIDYKNGIIYLTERERTEQLIKPILRGRDIKRYSYEWAGLWVINTHNGYTDSNNEKIPPIDIEEYPSLKTYFDKVANEGKKGKGKGFYDRDDKGKTPYNLRNCAYLQEFAKPKIVWNPVSGEYFFTHIKELMYFNNSLFMITQRHSNHPSHSDHPSRHFDVPRHSESFIRHSERSEESLRDVSLNAQHDKRDVSGIRPQHDAGAKTQHDVAKKHQHGKIAKSKHNIDSKDSTLLYILGLMNSTLYKWIITQITNLIQTGQYAYGAKDKIEKLPIPKISAKQERAFIDIVKEIIELKGLLSNNHKDVSATPQHDVGAKTQHNGKACYSDNLRHCESFPSHANDPRHFDVHRHSEYSSRHSEALAEESLKHNTESKKHNDTDSIAEKIKALEAKLDDMVFKLYNLTQDEIEHIYIYMQ